MNDFQYQASFVAGSVDRMLWQIDPDPLSPTHGCAHLAYWRDKTSDVSDARRQEALLPLALLYLREYPGSGWQGDGRLLRAVEGLASFWGRSLYSDGSLDEWYKGERAFAAAAFSAHAVARTLLVAESVLPPAATSAMRDGLARVSRWLVSRNDLFKTNHQAVGVGALAFSGHVLGERAFTEAAREKLHSIIRTQTPEGWFPEVGHTDPGYTFLTAEYVAMAMHLWNDFSEVQPFVKAFDFACEWVHPDGTLGTEYGVCHNPYVSRIASVLLADHCDRAASLKSLFQNSGPGNAGLRATLFDDLRLGRWAFQPLAAWDYLRDAQPENAASPSPSPLPLAAGLGDEIFNEASLARFSCAGRAGVFAPCAGGLVRFFGGAGSTFADLGYAVEQDGERFSTATYDRALGLETDGGAWMTICPVVPVKRFMPPYWARVGLRVACSTGTGSRLTRKFIDFIRKRKGTALNQSSANLSGSSKWRFERTVIRQDDAVEVVDALLFDQPVDAGAVRCMVERGAGIELLPLPVGDGATGAASRMEIRKRYIPGEQWQLARAVAELR